jgi:hypothetical protein
MFITALFTKAKIWKQPMCPTVNEWIKTVRMPITKYKNNKKCWQGCGKKDLLIDF